MKLKDVQLVVLLGPVMEIKLDCMKECWLGLGKV